MTDADRDDDGQVIAGRYRLQRRIGGGAMGVVWLAKDELLDRTVAVKLLLLAANLSESDAEQARKRSAREARLAARLQHRHAITVFDVADHDGMPVLVMEYLPSQSLAEVMHSRGRLPALEVARVGAHAASALAVAHAVGIVHRDVKPGNILLGEDGTAKITDFGISRAADDGTLTGSGSFAGTPAFLSPEAARGEQPTPASDVYALGATLYTIVEGRFPYGETDNQMALLYAAAAGRVSPPQYAGPLTDVLARMMRVKPEERPTMAELAGELAGLAEPRRERRRRPLLFAGIGAAVLVAGVVAIVLTMSNSGTRSAAATSSPAPVPPASSSPVTTSSRAASSPAIATPSSTEAVTEYYALMPGQTDLGWTKLGPGLQAQGKASYQAFWGTISALSVTGAPHLIGHDTVEVTIEFTTNGKRYRETHHLGMITTNGQMLINSDKPVSSAVIG
ncbi:MAG TPA: serine/threonine-protein kinase [Amycolatopsis sp.]|nr:serine/threonine-protein kinase [Amycolatopsis sp.]